MLQQCGVYMCVLTAYVCTVHVLVCLSRLTYLLFVCVCAFMYMFDFNLGFLDMVGRTKQLKDVTSGCRK